MFKFTSTQSRPRNIFRVKVGHVILGFLAFGSLLLLIFSSAAALASHNIDSRNLLTQESDASAMTFAQRESFNVILNFHDWSVGEASAREVQISRAILGQRLNVLTQSGQSTFELTEPEYRRALIALDRVIIGLDGVSEDQRLAYEALAEPQLDEFTTQTRHLSQTFEQISRNLIEKAVAERVQAEVYQAALIIVGLASGGALGAWVALDIVRGFRTIRNKIREQRQSLELARSRLLLVQNVDSKSRELIQDIRAGKPTETVLAEIKEYLLALTLDLWLAVKISDNQIQSFELLKDAASEIGEEDRQFMEHRLHEVVQAAVSRDVQQAQLSNERDFDNLTKLPNRNMFSGAVDESLQRLTAGQVAAIMLIDIDRFRDVNGSLGYAAGDKLLQEVARRLVEFKNFGENAARLSGDEFGFTGIYESREAATARANELLEALKFTTTLAGLESVVTSSLGVAISEPGIDDSGELTRCASLAIYLSKESGERAGFTIFSAADHESMMTTWHEELAVRNALRAGEFVMHFQPIVSLETHQPVGVEALIRWQRPGHGLVPPDEFLPVINRAGLTVELGSEVLRESLAAWSRTIQPAFSRSNFHDPYISINVEALQLQDPAFAVFVLGLAAAAGVPNQAIVIEVTEHALAGGEVVLQQLQALRLAGVRIALDDFGTGYSNLGQAQKMPLDILKIDKSFLDAVETDDRSHRMVADVTNMAKGQNLKVTAEGIESEQVAQLLAGMTVDYGQGYHFSRALPEASLEQWLASR